MKLEKAKEILEHELAEDVYHHNPDLSKALRLHIEASTFIILARVSNPGMVPALLHGETKD